MKTFTEICEKRLGEIFKEMKASKSLCSYITGGVPKACAAYLQSKIAETGEAEVSLPIKCNTGCLFTFKLNVNKKGDAVSFLPSFEMGELGNEYVAADTPKDDELFDETKVVEVAKEIAKNEAFVNCLKQAFKARIYVDGEWVADPSNTTNYGLDFDEENDICTAAASVFCTIIELLNFGKDPANDVEYTVDLLGVFKTSPSKTGYTVGLTFHKAFKADCKSDKLAEKLASN